MLEGFALSGDYIVGLKDKGFTIIDTPVYEEGQDLDNPEKTKKKLICTVELRDGQQIKYYPNKTSQKTIIAARGYQLENWVGFQGEFITKKQNVMGTEKEVIFVKE